MSGFIRKIQSKYLSKTETQAFIDHCVKHTQCFINNIGSVNTSKHSLIFFTTTHIY